MSGWITSHSPWRPNDDARAVRKEDRLLSPRANHRLKCVSPSRKKRKNVYLSPLPALWSVEIKTGFLHLVKEREDIIFSLCTGFFSHLVAQSKSGSLRIPFTVRLFLEVVRPGNLQNPAPAYVRSLLMRPKNGENSQVLHLRLSEAAGREKKRGKSLGSFWFPLPITHLSREFAREGEKKRMLYVQMSRRALIFSSGCTVMRFFFFLPLSSLIINVSRT